MGDADPPAPTPSGGICPIVSTPSIPWADTMAVLHTNSFIRDCAGGNRFTSWTGRPSIALHETGHSPFGLADEYCCDGGYWQPEPFPNVFADRSLDEWDCEADASVLGRQASACRSWVSTRVNSGSDWFTHDPTGNDLMEGSGGRTPQLLDIRRITWVFNGCRFRASC